MKPNSLKIFLLALALFVIDQATKFFAYRGNFGSFLNYLRPVFGKLIFPNSNFAFSLKFSHLIIYAVYFLLLVFLTVWFIRLENRSKKITLGFTLIVVGALSNIFDRIMLGYVRDFIYVFWGNIFNLADLYILAGIIFLIAD